MSPEADFLAPLQTIMLRDSLAAEGEGLHVEQVEIIFAEKFDGDQIHAAWAATVASTEVLQTAFVMECGEPVGWARTKATANLKRNEPVPASWEEWLAADRARPLLAADTVPWRVAYWPRDRRFVWTFHHALLDGRSMARILHGFFRNLDDGTPPDRLGLTTWTPPDGRMAARAADLFRDEFVDVKMAVSTNHPESGGASKAVRCLGNERATRLESVAAEMRVSPATILTWAWAQAVANASGADAAVIEQVRCGPPQPGKAGFTMNTLPLVVPRAEGGPAARQLQEFRARLLALREIESIAPYDLPPEVIALTNGPWASVIMIERGTLAHMAGAGERVESITLHEFPGGSLTAAAYHLPDLRLEVEGCRRNELLDRWENHLEEILGGNG